jgi:hypothetical protein
VGEPDQLVVDENFIHCVIARSDAAGESILESRAVEPSGKP